MKKKNLLKNIGFWILIFLIAFLPSFVGFWRFPKLLGDEGIYVSQAWWLVKFGKLGPYTYWYDHFPLGWFLIGAWQKLTGGPFSFGLSIFSGRLFMIFLKGLSGVFLFKTIKNLTKNKFVNYLGLVLFSFSPLLVLFHRQVLLDNIASFWLVVSLYFFTKEKNKFKDLFLSSIFLCLGILSKESLLFMLPAFLLGLFLRLKDKDKKYWFWILGLNFLFLLGLFPLLALLKGEFFLSQDKVSFLKTILFQSQRGNEYWFWEIESSFYKKLQFWLSIDPLIIFWGIGSLILNFLFQLKNKKLVSVSLFLLFFILFLLRRGIVLDFYIIPLLPVLVIEICALFDFCIKQMKISKLTNKLGVIFVLLLIVFTISNSKYLYTKNTVGNQIEAYDYLKNFKNKNVVIVADNFYYLDLKLRDGFENVEWYSKVEHDPAIRELKLENDSRRIDCLLVNSNMGQEIESDQLNFLKEVKESMVKKKEFNFEENFEFKNNSYLVEDLVLYGKEE